MGDVPSFGMWLKRRRKALDLTQDALAQLVGCAVVTIRKLESEVQPPSRQLAERLAEHLAIPSDQRATFVQFARMGLDAAPPELPLPPAALVLDSLPVSPRPPSRSHERSNLPTSLTPLIGREYEIEHVGALLRQPAVRLVTLTGPGGIGKTRLALQAAANLLDAVADGVVFVDVAPISDPAMVVGAIAEALGLKETAGLPLLETLKRYLRERELLLLLDNFEQVVDAAAVVAELLKAAHTLKVLVTSRTVLHLSGEHEFAVHPLSLPDRQPPPLFDQLCQYAAVALFIERGRTVLPDFQLTAMNARAVTEICRRLDGLPLALELAAARLKLFTPEELLARLDRRLPILTGGPRDLPARQQTLHSTIAWSYDLLWESECILLRRLAVFVGGWTLEAAEAVCMGESIPAWEVVELVAQLMHKSLVTVERYGDGSRYRMLETIREYAHEKLAEAGEERAVKARHCTFFTDWAEELEPKLRGAEQMLWLDRLEAEHDNLRAALAWSLNHDSQTGLRLAGALGWFWRVHSHFSEGRRWLEAACTTGGVPATLRVKALVHAGLLAYNQDSPQSTILFEESLNLSRRHNNQWGLGWSLQGLGRVAHQQGAYERAVSLLKQSLAPLRTVGDDGIAYTVYFLGLVAQDQGDYTQAARFLRESLAMTHEAGNTWLTAWTLTHLGQIAYAQGEYAEANAYLTEGLMSFQTLKSTWAVLRPLEGLALAAAGQGMQARLVRLLGFVAPRRESLGIPPYESEQAEFDRLLAVARHELESDAFDAAWAEGRAMSLEEAIAEALGGPA